MLPNKFQYLFKLNIQFIPSQLEIRKLIIADIIQKLQLNNLLGTVV